MKRILINGALIMPIGICQAINPTMDVAKNNRPNIVIVLGDDCSYSDLSCYGSKNAITPNLDKMAQEGVVFDNCYQATAMSSPTRHCLYTGLYPIKSGAYPNHTFVKGDVKSFVQYFKNIGYRTALYGKEHIDPKSVFSYDYLGEYKDGNMNFKKLKDYITADSDSPFFLVIASHESHAPYTVGNPNHWKESEINLPPHYIDTPGMRNAYVKYLAEIEVLDSQVGEVEKMLKETNNDQSTVCIFLSEQGNGFPFAKFTCYNQGLHSGLIVKYPSMIKKPYRSGALVEYVDIIPTLLELAGVNPEKETALDGKSFCDVLKGKKKNHKKYAFGIQTTRGILDGADYYGVRSVTDSEYTYILNLTPAVGFQCGINKSEVNNSDMYGWVREARNGNEFAKSQIHRYRYRPAEELYNVKDDPFSLHNLANDSNYKKHMKEMNKVLLQWMKKQGDKGQKTEMEALEHMTQDYLKTRCQKEK